MISSQKPSWVEKILVTCLSPICLGLLLSCRTLQPDPRGYGTHESFSTPCHFQVVTGYPCPTCGITTSFAHLSRGSLWQGIQAQPFGFLLFLICLLLPLATLWMWLSNRSFLQPLGNHTTLVLFFLFTAFIASWIFKLLQSHFH